MAIFGGKDREITEDDSEALKVDRKITRKLKDLKPENRKKRKEPPKPWGKKERLIILVVFLATVIISAIMSFSGSFRMTIKNFKLSLPRVGFDSINFFKGKTIIIEKK